MSELRPNLTPENFGSRVEAAPLTSDTEVDLHKSTLQSAEKGREFARAARAAIDAQLSRERPPRPTAQQELAGIGMRLADLRRWAVESGEGEGTPIFRQATTESEQSVSATTLPDQIIGDLEQMAIADEDFDQWASEFKQRPSEMGTGYEELAQPRR